jgi:hypothetical protein
MTEFVSGCCKGELCFCGEAASHKVEETIFFDDPLPQRHPLTAYVCDKHFRHIMGPASTFTDKPVAWLLTWTNGQKAVWLEKPNLNPEITVQPLYTSGQTPAHLEELAQWADAAVELFPVHGGKFKEIAIALRSGREALKES